MNQQKNQQKSWKRDFSQSENFYNIYTYEPEKIDGKKMFKIAMDFDCKAELNNINNDDVFTYLKAQIDYFLTTNDTPCVALNDYKICEHYRKEMGFPYSQKKIDAAKEEYVRRFSTESETPIKLSKKEIFKRKINGLKSLFNKIFSFSLCSILIIVFSPWLLYKFLYQRFSPRAA